MLAILIFIFFSSLSFAGEGDPAFRISPNKVNDPSSIAEAGATLLVQHLNDKESISGTCQIVNDASDHLPMPCSMVKFSLTPVSQREGQARSFQTTSSGTLSMGDLKSDKYQLHVASSGYRLMSPDPVIVQRGQKVLITLIRLDKKK